VSAVFITGTGTGVGKTFVCTGLIRYFRGLGQPVAALKPLVSGFDLAAPSGSDPAVFLEALGREVTPDELLLAVIALGVDCGATEFFQDGKYVYASEGKTRTPQEQAQYLAKLLADYPIVSIAEMAGSVSV
jgi:hypothetical protein